MNMPQGMWSGHAPRGARAAENGRRAYGKMAEAATTALSRPWGGARS
ncbi:MAG TPA: hypothetical protein VHN18_20175 [Micromonosporaceae bacterium]|nr:hypothetical protein [Micromonosporaceae bacterium]